MANAWALIAAWQIQRSPGGGSLDLPLMAMPGESTVTLLRIEWDAVADVRLLDAGTPAAP